MDGAESVDLIGLESDCGMEACVHVHNRAEGEMAQSMTVASRMGGWTNRTGFN